MSASGSLHVISLGAGVQSSVMLLMAATGELPLPAAAIFADTQWEPRRVYGHLAWLESEVVRLTDGKLPIYRVTAGDIRSGVSAKRRFTPIPLFTASGGMGRRQCTRQYKIAPIKKKVRPPHHPGPGPDGSGVRLPPLRVVPALRRWLALWMLSLDLGGE